LEGGERDRAMTGIELFLSKLAGHAPRESPRTGLCSLLAAVLTLAATTAPTAGEHSPRELYEKASAAVGLVTVFDASGEPKQTGSGFVVGPKLLVTNYHVIRGGTSATVELPNGTIYRIKTVQAVGCTADLALLDIATTDSLPSLQLARPGGLGVGDPVFAIGNPRGGGGGLTQNSLSNGVVSGLRVLEGVNLIQSTAAISPGSSGGPLLNEAGGVVGVTTFRVGGESLNFAIDASELVAVLASREPRGFSAYANSCPTGQPAPAADATDPNPVSSARIVAGTYLGSWVSNVYSVRGELVVTVSVAESLKVEAVFTGSRLLSREILTGALRDMGGGVWSAEVRAKRTNLSAVLILSSGVLRGDFKFDYGTIHDTGTWLANRR
jgi:hypothetical protein